MTQRTPRTVLAALVFAVVGASAASAAADGFVLIGNAQTAVVSLSRAEVKALYTGKSKTLGGSAVVVVIRPEQDAPFTQFVDQLFGIPTKTLLLKIHQEVFKGEMTKPFRAASDDEVVQHVGSSPGTLGVVSTAGAEHLPKTVTVIALGG
jgi:ABC-type phosphate transport system substrate-binding protein